jgi:hypothetical protein
MSERLGEPTPQSCETCRFFRHLPVVTPYVVTVSGDGTCRRRAPGPVSHVGDLSDPAVAWPAVRLADWCGEWQEIPPR